MDHGTYKSDEKTPKLLLFLQWKMWQGNEIAILDKSTQNNQFDIYIFWKTFHKVIVISL